VNKISDSIQLILNLGVDHLHFSLSLINPWRKSSLDKLKKEMDQLKDILLKRYKTKGDIPLVDFRPKKDKGFFYCSAGQDRMAITPDGNVWGCFLFPEYKSHGKSTQNPGDFFFGDLDTFITNHEKIYPRISSNYRQLSMDRFKTPHMDCFLCPYLEKCGVCPVNISFTGYPLGEIPDYVCQIHKIKIQMKDEFLKEIEKI
jgi:radical SAM protein with 4Fe4S-binding SPASM domain